MRMSEFVKSFFTVIQTGSTTVANQFVSFFGGMFASAATGGVLTVALPQAASIAIDASLGNNFVVTLGTNAAFILANPTNPPPAGHDQIITITVKNASGGAHGAGTFGNLFLTSANVPAIADTKNRTLAFRWDGTNWVELWRTAADVAN